jgi:hypothetical protein
MNRKLEKIQKFREHLNKQIESLTGQQLNHIPDGYHNNIVWNLGHMISAQQTMCYVRAGLSVVVDERFYTPYLSGTRPEKFIDEQEIRMVKDLFITAIDRLQADLEKNIFENYSPSVMIPKVYGFEVNNIDEAIEYLLYHDGLHTGCIMSLKHLV